MHLSSTMPTLLLAGITCKQCNALSVNYLGGGYYDANNLQPFLTNNHFRCFHKVSECVAELTKSMRSCQNSWKKRHFSQYICRMKYFVCTFVEKMRKQNQ